MSIYQKPRISKYFHFWLVAYRGKGYPAWSFARAVAVAIKLRKRELGMQ